MQAPGAGSIQPAGRVPVRRAQTPTCAPPNVATRRCRAYTATLASSSAPNDRPIRSVVTHACIHHSVSHSPTLFTWPETEGLPRPRSTTARGCMDGVGRRLHQAAARQAGTPGERRLARATPTRSTSRASWPGHLSSSVATARQPRTYVRFAKRPAGPVRPRHTHARDRPSPTGTWVVFGVTVATDRT